MVAYRSRANMRDNEKYWTLNEAESEIYASINFRVRSDRFMRQLEEVLKYVKRENWLEMLGHIDNMVATLSQLWHDWQKDPEMETVREMMAQGELSSP